MFLGTFSFLIFIWNLKKNYISVLKGHENVITKMKLNNNENKLYSCSDKGDLILWDINRKQILIKI